MKDIEVIDAFIKYLNKNGHSGLEICRRPDEENRITSDVDAIAGNYAIEHTSIDTIPNQRRDSNWFMQVAGDIERGLLQTPPFRLNITIEYGSIAKGQDWRAIRQSIINWINEESLHIDDGYRIIDDLQSVPFRLHVIKRSNRSHRVLMGRFTPKDDTLSTRIYEQFERKATKLKKYKADGLLTILLVESEDLILMDEFTMLDAIRKAYPKNLPEGVDMIWFVDTSIPKAIEFFDFTKAINN